MLGGLRPPRGFCICGSATLGVWPSARTASNTRLAGQVFMTPLSFADRDLVCQDSHVVAARLDHASLLPGPAPREHAAATRPPALRCDRRRSYGAYPNPNPRHERRLKFRAGDLDDLEPRYLDSDGRREMGGPARAPCEHGAIPATKSPQVLLGVSLRAARSRKGLEAESVEQGEACVSRPSWQQLMVGAAAGAAAAAGEFS